MHPAGSSSAAAARKAGRFRIFQVVGDLVEKGIEELLKRTLAEFLVSDIDPDQPADSVIPAKHPLGCSVVDLELKWDPATMDPLEAGVKKGSEHRNRDIELGRGRSLPRWHGEAA